MQSRAAKILAHRERSRARAAASGLTIAQRAGAFLRRSGTARCVAAVFINSKPQCGLHRRK
jgi:hypothetical protein